MSRAKRVLLALVCAVFTAVGVLILVLAETTEDVLGAVMVILFFGVGGAAAVVAPSFTRKGRDGTRTGVVEHRGARVPALVFPRSRAKMRLGFVGCSAIAVAGAIMLVLGARLVGIVTVLLFGGVAVVGARNAFFGEAFVALLPDGVLARGGGRSTFVPWDAIREVDMLDIQGTPMVSVSADPAAVETSTGRQLGMIVSRGAGYPELSFSGLVAPEKTLRSAIEHYLHHPGERERIGTDARLDPAVPR